MMPRECERLEASARARRPADARSPGSTADVALEHMRIDKKVQAGRMRLVLLRAIGEAFVTADYPGRGAATRRSRRTSRHDASASPPPSLAPYAAHDERSRGRRYPGAAARSFAPNSSATAIASSTPTRSAGWSTRRRCSSITKATSTARASPTRSKWRRSRARSRWPCNVNETLTEAISLAHDLGPHAFGHAGQDALNECMRPYGGFEHNLQSLRVVDELEERYAEFRGLNLTFEMPRRHSQALLACAMRASWASRRALHQAHASPASRRRSRTSRTRSPTTTTTSMTASAPS